MSEISGGFRAIWTGKKFVLQVSSHQPSTSSPRSQYQQQQQQVHLVPPEWFRQQLPSSFYLDGHLVPDCIPRSQTETDTHQHTTPTTVAATTPVTPSLTHTSPFYHLKRALHGNIRRKGVTNQSNNSNSDDCDNSNNNDDSNNNASKYKVVELSEEEWQQLRFVVSDTPHLTARDKPYLSRLETITHALLQQQQQQQQRQRVTVVSVEECTGVDHMHAKFGEVIRRGGQGILLKDPAAPYLPGFPLMWKKDVCFFLAFL